MKKIRLGFIGCGLCARDLHWPALAQLRDRFEVVNVCSRTSEKAQRHALLTGSLRYCTSIDELLSDNEVDAVIINYPFEMNLEITEKALNAGKHVIVEKPMARNMKEAQRMLELESNTNLVTMIAENFRYRPSITTAKKMIQDGKIGEPSAMLVRELEHFPRNAKWLTESSWRLSCVGGVMLDRDVHWFASMRELFGDVRKAIGYQRRIRDDIGPVDQVTLQMIFENGAVGTFIDVASMVGPKEQPYVIIGSKGTITISGFRTVKLDQIEGKSETISFEGGDGGGYVEEFTDFYNAITNGTHPRSSFAECYKDYQLGMTSLETNSAWETLDLVK